MPHRARVAPRLSAIPGDRWLGCSALPIKGYTGEKGWPSEIPGSPRMCVFTVKTMSVDAFTQPFYLGTSKSRVLRRVRLGYGVLWNVLLYHEESQPSLTTAWSSCATILLFTARIRSPSRRPWRWAEVPGSTLYTTWSALPSCCCRWNPKLFSSSLLNRQKRGRCRFQGSGGGDR